MDLGEALEAAGFDTQLAPNLASAREALRNMSCALVLLDLLLPDGDGLDFLSEIRSTPATSAGIMRWTTTAICRSCAPPPRRVA